MKRPERFKEPESCQSNEGMYQYGYNQAITDCDEWLKQNQQEMIDIHGMRHDVVVIEREGL